MVRLTMTKAMVAALEYCSIAEDSTWPPAPIDTEPSIENPVLGHSITHSQVLELAKHLRKHAEDNDNAADMKAQNVAFDLDTLLRGSTVYIEPPKPKPEPSPEYKALMARLRAEEEERKYAAMVNAPAHSQTFTERFPNSPYAHLFPDSARPSPTPDGVLHDEVSFQDINRQLALIANVLISIVACSVAIWWGTWHWSTGWRLGASMGGSGIVGVAEIVVYMGYVSRMDMAKMKEKKKVERKSVAKTWIIEGRKGVIEKRVVGGETKDKLASGSDWVEAPGTLRHRDKGKMR